MNIIPQPHSVKKRSGLFIINKQTRIVLNGDNGDLDKLASLLSERFEKAAGWTLEIVTAEEVVDSAIYLSIDTDPIDLSISGFSGNGSSSEGYILSVDGKGINIKASGKEGIFYGIQTLLQLLPAQIYSETYVSGVEWSVPYVEIVDAPRFPWRGMHLDVSRHFFPPEFIKRYIDYIAMHKMNVFHWHLTDDNGWRLEIKKHPKLTSVSAWRADQEDRQWNDRPACSPEGKKVYGGFYTQKEVKEIVAYATERHITVIPEIEMPAHTSEIFAAYPELCCLDGSHYVKSGGYWPNTDIFCAGNDEVFSFLEDVLDEVLEIFPSEYIHIGGDEANKTHWENCPKCNTRMKEENLADVVELENWFLRRIGKYLVSRGRKLACWELPNRAGGAPKEAKVISWAGKDPVRACDAMPFDADSGIKEVQMGYDVIMMPCSHCYFDFYQNDREFEKEAIGGYTTLKEVYSFEPVPEGLSSDEEKHIIGGQGCAWTEYMPDSNHVEYMIMPRMSALSEVLWSPAESRDWYDFLSRVQEQYKRFDFAGINYCKGTEIAAVKTVRDDSTGKIYVEMESELFAAEVHYTLDESDPDETSDIYSEPVEIEGPIIVKAIVVIDGKPLRKAVTMKIDSSKEDKK